MKVIAVSNQKGGVGKTTTTASLSTEFALAGQRTLMIDADPQSNLSRVFLAPEAIKTSLANVLISQPKQELDSISQQRLTTVIEGLDIVPATINLATFDREPASAIKRLRSALKEVSGEYDLVVIDTPPNFGLLLSTALMAAHFVIIPVQAAPFALQGLEDLLAVINDVGDLNEHLKILGTLCTRYDKRTRISKDSLEDLQQICATHQYPVFETIIHQDTNLEASPRANEPIQLFAPNSRGAEEYAKLAEEILPQLGLAHQNSGLQLVKGVKSA